MAVYTKLETKEIRQFLWGYNLPPLAKAEGVREGVENTNYLLTLTDGSRLILTLFEKRVAEADLPFFARLMTQLSSHGIPCPLPVHAEDGDVLGTLRGKAALLVTFLEGRPAGIATPAHLRELGAWMARIHRAAEGCSGAPENALSISGWQAIFSKIRSRADRMASGLAQEVEEELAFLRAQWPGDLPRGIIHADLFPDNVFFTDGSLSGIIDFYFACEDFYAYDLAVAMNAWCFAKGQFQAPLAHALFEGYSGERPLIEEERAAFPVLARGAALRFLLTRAHDKLFGPEEALVTPKDPLEYRAKLHFHRQLRDAGAYGLAS